MELGRSGRPMMTSASPGRGGCDGDGAGRAQRGTGSSNKDRKICRSVKGRLPEFQCRVLGDDPVAEPRGAAGSHSNIIISVRRERPSSIVRPQPESCPFRFGVVSLGPVYGWHPLEVATAASRRRQRVGLIAGRSADQRCWVGAALVRASQWIKRRNAPQFSAVSIGVVSKSTPYLAALARRRRPHHRIRRRGGRTSPQPEFKKWRRRPAGGASGSVRLRVGLLTNVAGKISKKNSRKRNWRSAAQPARAGRSAGGARRSAPPRTRAREMRAIKANAARAG